MNPLAAIVALLRADTDVAALVGTRVFGGELPQSQASAMPRHAVVLTLSGGGSLGPGANSYVPWTVNRMDMRCYGRDPLEAWTLYEAVDAVMRNLRRETSASTLIHDATISGGPISNRDNDTDWPYVLSVYDVSAARDA